MNAITPRFLEDSFSFKQAFAALKFTGPLAGATPDDQSTTVGGLIIKTNTTGDGVLQIIDTNSVEKFNIKFKAGIMTTSGLTKTARAVNDTKNDFIGNNAGTFVTADGYWLAMQPVALTDAANIVFDLTLGINFSVTLGGNRTLALPTSLRVGQRGYIRILQDGVGGRTITFAPGYRYADSSTPPILNSTANDVTVIRYDVTGTNEVSLSGGKGLSPVVIEATAAEIRQGVAGRVVAPDKLWSANAIVPLSETDLVNGLNFNNFINATVTLTANRVIGNPVAASMKPGQSGFITFIMGGFGNYSVTFADQWWTTNGLLPSLPGAVGGIHRMYYTVTDAGTVDFYFGTKMGRTFTSEVGAYFDAIQVQPSNARKQLISDIITGLKADGVWDYLDNLWLLASHDEQASRVNLVRPSKILTKSGTPYFVEDRGWQQTINAGETGNNRLLSPDPYIGRTLKRNTVANVSFGIWQNTAYPVTANQNNLCGDNGAGDREFIIDRAPTIYYEGDGLTNGNGPYITVGLDNGTQIQVGTPALKGFKALSSLGANAQSYYAVYNNRQSGGGSSGKYGPTSSATANESASFSILNSGSMSRTDNYGTKNRMAAAYTGAGLTPAQLSALYSRLNTYLTAIGAN